MWCRRLLWLLFAGLTAGTAAEWQPVTWNGEPAYASSSQGWRAVVSLARARLMHFGPDGTDTNLLLAPTSRANPNRLGGHRLWLGPQAEWPHGWPPPAAWEYREAEKVSVEAGVLRLVMPPTNDGWPQLTRTYRWAGESLVCGAEIAGGTRPVQVVHILQVPADTVVSAEVRPGDGFPEGYVRLPSTAGPFAARFPPPAHAVLAGAKLSLHHTGAVGKFGFRPQALTGRTPDHTLVVARGAQAGTVVGEPDEGFHTQVYLSESGEAFVELEQLSPRFAAGSPARFEIILHGSAR
jgi:hypothetical protein